MRRTIIGRTVTRALLACSALLALLAAGPSSMAATVTDIANNAVVTGSILVADDVDEYRFDATAKSGLGINLKTDPGVFIDLGLSLLDPSGDPVDLTAAKTYRDKFRQIIIGGLQVEETGTYRLFVTAAAPCVYTLKLSTTPCPNFTSTVTLPPGGEVVVPVSAPEHSRLSILVQARTRSRAQPRLGALGAFDLSQSGRFTRRLHRTSVPDSGHDRDFGLAVRDLGGLGGKVRVQVQVKAPKVAKGTYDSSDRTEITSIVAGGGQVQLEWLPTLDATSYTIYWSNTPGIGYGQGQHGTAIAGITGTQYTHTGLQNGLRYYYAVTATCEPHRERERSRERSVDLAPDAPTGVAATAGNGLVDLTWNAAVGATSYRIYWSTLPGVNPQNGELIDGIEGLAYTQTGLMNGETYHYVLTSVGAGGESHPSPQVTASLVPNAPSTISASAADGVVTIQWSDSYGATSYNLYRGTASGVTKETGQLIDDVSSPYNDTTVVNGTMYYYVATAVGLGGESTESSQVAARPLPTPQAPLNLTAAVTEETTNSVTLTWDPPVIGADSYTLYWDTEPGVTIGSNPIPNVTSPFIHGGLSGQTAYYYIVTSTLFGVESDASNEVSATPHGSPSGGDDTGYGNNLSFPVVFADGYGIGGAKLGTSTTPYLDTATGLRPTATDIVEPFPYFDPADAVVRNLVTYYRQQSRSTWQADWVDGSSERQDVIVDWGDNLRSQSFKTTSVVRVETTLLEDTTSSAPDDTLTAYTMTILEGSQTTEMQGTSGVTYESNLRTVYTVHPRLLIQKLKGRGGDVDETVEGIELAVADRFGTDGTGTYGAEINVGGKVVYGYVWQLKSMSLSDAEKRGWWRITFALDSSVTMGSETVARNTKLVTIDAADAAAATLAEDGSSTSIEVQVN